MKNSKYKVKPPPHLRKESAAFFNSVMTDYTLDDHHVTLLTKACESLDRIELNLASVLAGPVRRNMKCWA